MAAPTIISITPASGAVGVPVNTTISIIFDQEVDNYRLANGGLIVEGPDGDKAIGPAMQSAFPPDTDDATFLSSPGWKGIVDVDYTFYRVDNTGAVVPYFDYGYSGAVGALFRTKVVLTPKDVLGSLTEYTTYIVGDENQTDDYTAGVSSRTVFDTIKDAVIGDGDVNFYGGYTGTVRDQFHLKITTAGAAGTAKYEWWTDLDPLHRTGTSSTGYRLLKDGVKAQFVAGKTYELNDSFSVWCSPPVFMEDSYSASFTTSEHSVTTLPEASTIVYGIGSGVGVTSSTFYVTETSPADRQSLVPITTTSITIGFSQAIESSTVTDSTVTVQGLPADESNDDSIDHTDTLTKTLSVSGSTLTITLSASQLYENNLIVVTLDSTIAATDGTTLSEDYEFFFGTTFNPFYAGTRHVRLRLGGIANTFPDETVNLAIWIASKEVLALTPPSIFDSKGYNQAKVMFTVCLASWYLVGGGSGAGSGQRKRLADLDVSTEGGNTKSLLDDLQKCFERYELALRSGGEAGFGTQLRPVNAIKGENDPDCPPFGRTWTYSDLPMSNIRTRDSSYRRWYNTYLPNYTRWWGSS